MQTREKTNNESLSETTVSGLFVGNYHLGLVFMNAYGGMQIIENGTGS